MDERVEEATAVAEAHAEASLKRGQVGLLLRRHMGRNVGHDAGLYQSHARPGARKRWPCYGVDRTAHCLVTAGARQPTLIVLPQGDEGYWLNHAGGERWGDYVASDVVTSVDATYRTLPAAGSRAVGGLSMGGHGALQL